MKAWTKRDVLAYLHRVEDATIELNHFSLLDVAPDASDDEIQRAFHRVAGGIHPDRHRTVLTPEQRERVTVVYARIAEAYRVLRDKHARDRYSRKLAEAHRSGHLGEPRSTDESSVLSPKAQRLYRRAKSALSRGDRTSAVLNLKMALRLHPTSDLLKATLAQLASK